MAHVRGRVRRAAKRAIDEVGSTYSVSAVAALECRDSTWTGDGLRCRWCNTALEGRRTAWCSTECHERFEKNHIWPEARKLTLRKARNVCQRRGCKVKTNLQVNHIDPVVGQGYRPSCYHHLTNLEALCRPHHQEATNAQREWRKTHWAAEPQVRQLPLPSSTLPQASREDLLKRMLDRASGFPFVLAREDFLALGQYYAYHPNLNRAKAEADLRQRHPEALLWSSEKQTWVTL